MPPSLLPLYLPSRPLGVTPPALPSQVRRLTFVSECRPLGSAPPAFRPTPCWHRRRSWLPAWADRRRCCCAAHHPASRVPRGCAYAPLMGGQRRRLRAARRWTRFERVAGEAAGRTQSNCSSGSRPRASRFPSLRGTRCSPRAVSASAGKSRSSCWSGWAPQPTPSHTTRCCTRCDGPSTTMRRWACGPRCTRPTPTPSTTCSRSAARPDGGPRRRRCWQGWSRCGSLVGKWPMSPRGGATARPPGLLGQTPQARTCSAHALRTPEEHSSRSALQEERRCRRQRRPIR